MFFLCDSNAAVEDSVRLEAFVDLILVARPPGSESAAEVLSLAYQHSFFKSRIARKWRVT